MARPRQIREIALQVLCVWDANNEVDERGALQMAMDAEPKDANTRVAAIEAAHATWAYRKQADEMITRLAPNWPPYRQPSVDRNLLRLSLWELMSRPTPPKVVVDEAIEIAKEYSTENSGGFVNGVLDAAMKELGHLKS